MKIALVTGGFDPLHSGHIKYFKAAAKQGDKLYVGINSNEWLIQKKGKPFMPYEERAAIIKELKCVDGIVEFDDGDGSSSDAIQELLTPFSDQKFKQVSNLTSLFKLEDLYRHWQLTLNTKEQVLYFVMVVIGSEIIYQKLIYLLTMTE